MGGTQSKPWQEQRERHRRLKEHLGSSRFMGLGPVRMGRKKRMMQGNGKVSRASPCKANKTKRL